MVRIFFVAVIVLGVASGILSFKNKGTLADVRAKAAQLETDLSKKTAEAKAASEELTASKEAIAKIVSSKDEAAAAAAKAQGEATRLGDQLKEAQNALKAKDEEVAKLKEEASKAQVAEATPAVNPELEAKIKELEVKLAEQTTVAQALEAKKKEADSKLADLEQREAQRASNMSRPGLEGKILVVNPGWNFVILNMGDRQGVALNSTLLVMRGSERIARLKVTSIDPNRAIADIVPGSTTKGTSVLPGDKVIFSAGS